MLTRLLILAGLAWLGWTLWKQWSGQLRPPGGHNHRQDLQADRERFEPMARCPQCGTYLPVSTLSRSGRCGRCSD
ncbi:hypothetical protein [Hydrocarboniphaga effusa]|jgi:hypothetical protein|uniref:hypothetical protein n=1 Tax=Hydrocarboniphaga effusa TaxID=243629 RepID=UPI00398C172F